MLGVKAISSPEKVTGRFYGSRLSRSVNKLKEQTNEVVRNSKMSSQIKPFICMTGIIAVCGMFGFFVSTKISERSPIAAEVDALELAVNQPTRSVSLSAAVAPKKYTGKFRVLRECEDKATSQQEWNQCQLDDAKRARIAVFGE